MALDGNNEYYSDRINCVDEFRLCFLVDDKSARTVTFYH